MKLTQEQIERIQSLEDAAGRVTPDRVVEDAEARDSPLHSLFEWNKGKAARAHWLLQAREIIGSVMYAHTTSTVTVRAPMYVKDMSVQGQGYRTVVALKSDPVAARESLIYTLNTAAGHIRRGVDLASQVGLSAELDQLLAEIIGVQRMLESQAA